MEDAREVKVDIEPGALEYIKRKSIDSLTVGIVKLGGG